MKERIKSNEGLIYGVNVIRKELRDTPKGNLLLNRNLRISLLSLYDEFVGRHIIRLSNEVIKNAEKYYKVYREFGGMRPIKEVINDFYIVACASCRGMDVVVSKDKATMLGELSLKSYKIVNDILNLRTPKFWDYDYFKRWLL